jgi:hypothetical protein
VVQGTIANRSDPIEDCGSAQPAELLESAVTINQSTATFTALPILLATQSTSMRPPATLAVGPKVVIAAPNGSDVGVWSVDASTTTAPPPLSIPGLAGARAVSIATDGAGNFAVVAEIGCQPGSIAMALGTLTGGFKQTITVVPKGTSSAVQPTVAWAATNAAPGFGAPSSWDVGWIAVSGGPHVKAMRFDSNGNPLGGVIDPGVNGVGATVTSTGSVLAYVPTPNAFVNTSLGCVE